MKVLTVQQPWASLIIGGQKDVENRSRPTSYRGPLYIHAGKTIDRDAMEDLAALYAESGEQVKFPTGVIIGCVQLVGCVTQSRSEWFSGPYGWVLARPYALNRPIPARGKLGLWEFSPS